MSRFPLLAAALATASLAAQQSLADLERRFRDELQATAQTAPDQSKRQQLLARHIQELRRFLTASARGDDRWNGRLMLADLELARGDRAGAAAALRELDAGEAPALVLVTAAAMAQHLRLDAERQRWIVAAVTKQAPLPDRLAMARLLQTVLGEVERGETLFAAALAEAGDDEQRAFVRWHRADALRDREDLPENQAFDELQLLADELPGTYWGSVAKDRLRATRLAPGDPAIDFTARTLDGAEVSLASQRGKTVVLAFWTYADFDTPKLIEILAGLQRSRGDKLFVLGISLDRDPAAIAAAAKQLGITFPVVGDGQGVMTDAALRWFVEGPVVHVVDPEGKVRALGLQVGTADGRAELIEAVTR